MTREGFLMWKVNYISTVSVPELQRANKEGV